MLYLSSPVAPAAGRPPARLAFSLELPGRGPVACFGDSNFVPNCPVQPSRPVPGFTAPAGRYNLVSSMGVRYKSVPYFNQFLNPIGCTHHSKPLKFALEKGFIAERAGPRSCRVAGASSRLESRERIVGLGCGGVAVLPGGSRPSPAVARGGAAVGLKIGLAFHIGNGMERLFAADVEKS